MPTASWERMLKNTDILYHVSFSLQIFGRYTETATAISVNICICVECQKEDMSINKKT